MGWRLGKRLKRLKITGDREGLEVGISRIFVIARENGMKYGETGSSWSIEPGLPTAQCCCPNYRKMGTRFSPLLAVNI